MFNTKKCILCNFDQQKKNFLDIYNNNINNNPILYETEHFYITIDLHPISDCHYLIIPKQKDDNKHITSYSLVPINFDKEFKSLIDVIKCKSQVKDYILFEHGSGIINNNLTGCGNSVFHAHMHFVGNLKYSFTDIITLMSNYNLHPNEFFMKKVLNDNLLQTIYSATCDNNSLNSPYLFLKYNDQDCFIIPERYEIKIQSQFFRKIFAEEINGKNCFWNWKNGISNEEKLIIKRRISKMIDNFTENKIKYI